MFERRYNLRKPTILRIYYLPQEGHGSFIDKCIHKVLAGFKLTRDDIEREFRGASNSGRDDSGDRSDGLIRRHREWSLAGVPSIRIKTQPAFLAAARKWAFGCARNRHSWGYGKGPLF